MGSLTYQKTWYNKTMINKTKPNNTKPGIAKYTHLNTNRFPKTQGPQPQLSVSFLVAIPRIPFDHQQGGVDIPKASQVPIPTKLLSELQIQRVFGEQLKYSRRG